VYCRLNDSHEDINDRHRVHIYIYVMYLREAIKKYIYRISYMYARFTKNQKSSFRNPVRVYSLVYYMYTCTRRPNECAGFHGSFTSIFRFDSTRRRDQNPVSFLTRDVLAIVVYVARRYYCRRHFPGWAIRICFNV